MAERPILFSAPMVRALLAGTKTQTRRVLKLPVEVAANDVLLTGMQAGYPDGIRPVWEYFDDPNAFSTVCTYGQPGDRLWVREAFAGSIAYERRGYPLKEWGNKIWYVADGEPRSGQWTRPRPSIHMPRCLSRITLEVTEVRVERLQAISEADAIAEGLMVMNGQALYTAPLPRVGWWETDPRVAYRDLWEAINGPGSWEANPWVWVLSFKRVEN